MYLLGCEPSLLLLRISYVHIIVTYSCSSVLCEVSIVTAHWGTKGYLIPILLHLFCVWIANIHIAVNENVMCAYTMRKLWNLTNGYSGTPFYGYNHGKLGLVGALRAHLGLSKVAFIEIERWLSISGGLN